ncbi:short-chain dehydrogenase [Microthyrium microscopicum]|uniref:Short-chain dehydrogenase n=1 Tax=Microthyrium microscopicum TaxID=703497 RepID=A0A6A6UGM6_9PEZI|nr:short-chain dehydrogenase [Microthyrium microscopicum]
MSTVKSADMAPNERGSLSIFIHSQFFGKHRPPPDSTDLSSKTAVVSGANVGLGFECCRQLLHFKLSHLVLAVRSIQRGEEAAAKLKTEYPKAVIEVMQLDMLSYDSIQAFVQNISKLPRIDIAILNAGMVAPEFVINEATGHERVIQTNYLSTMLLSILLLPVLKSNSSTGIPGRLTIVGSGVSYFAKMPNQNENPLLASFDDTKIMAWDPNERYFSSKVMVSMGLTKIVEYVNPDDVIVNVVDPGYCKGSDLHRDVHGILSAIIGFSKTLTARTAVVGASTYLDAAVVRGKDSHGCFLMDWDVKPFPKLMHGEQGRKIADKLWAETMKEFEFANAKGILEGLKA